MIKILIADDHPIVRCGLRQILETEANLQVAGEAEDARQVLKLVQQRPCDIVILDISMPGMDGIEILKEIKRLRPQLPILILSMHPEAQYAIRCIRAGASGYLTKDSVPEMLVTAIRKILRGEKFISPNLAEIMLQDLQINHHGALHEDLSDREFQVMHMIAAGKTVSRIAEEIFLSVKTVSTYRARVLKKMGLKSNAELTRYAFENKLVDQ
jgi:two-component system invasion response regulator UvrY